jgi:hypothetical protein
MGITFESLSEKQEFGVRRLIRALTLFDVKTALSCLLS